MNRYIHCCHIQNKMLCSSRFEQVIRPEKDEKFLSVERIHKEILFARQLHTIDPNTNYEVELRIRVPVRTEDIKGYTKQRFTERRYSDGVRDRDGICEKKSVLTNTIFHFASIHTSSEVIQKVSTQIVSESEQLRYSKTIGNIRIDITIGIKSRIEIEALDIYDDNIAQRMFIIYSKYKTKYFGIIEPLEYNRIKLTNIPFLKPKNISFILDYNNKYVTYKADGQRKLLLGTEEGLYSFDTVNNVKKISNKSYDFILDTEYLNGKYLIFDIISEGNIKQRMDKIKQLIPTLDISCSLKEYFRIKSKTSLQEFWKNRPLKKIDGLIIINNTKHYKTSNPLKWKENFTVDLLNPPSIICDLNVEQLSIKNIVLEYKKEGNNLVIVKTRPDRIKGNPLIIVKSCLNYVDYLIDDNMLTMRKLHNRMKSRMIKMSIKYGSKLLLDIGTGAGGDINKWKNFDEITSVEPDFGTFRQRNKNIPLNINMIEKKLHKVDSDIRCDTINLFFVLTLFNDKDFEKLYQIIKKQKKIRVNILFYDGSETVVNNLFSVIKLNNNNNLINIKDSNVIDIVENIITKESIVAKLKSLNMNIKISKYLKKEECLSHTENLFHTKIVQIIATL